MAHNSKEIKKMKSVRCIFLMLFSGLLLVLGGCEFRDMLDDYPVSGVQIKLNWTGVTDKLPETMRVIFYPKDDEGRKVETYLPPAGGEVKVPPGHYAVVIYNYNTESVLIHGDESYETIEAYTGGCTGLDTKGEDMVWSPDPLYVVALNDVDIEKSDDVFLMEYKPEAVVKRFSFEVKVAGLYNVSNIICHISGMNGTYNLGARCCKLSASPIYVDTSKGDGVIKGSFSGFVLPKSATTKADISVTLTLKLVKLDNVVQEVKADITKVVNPPTPDPGDNPGTGPGEEETPNMDVTIDIPLEEDIVVDDVIPEPGSGGGIGGDVGDWGDEDNVELPV
ncbi:DUF5119 domain-containing protein [Bacteroides sp.]|uniref:DUF5119 domain-containing protein n=1 Tax=Bacteroides sp. TaxID=29523 RepID=UPI00262C3C4B|nr:DUF5119 domain-containing protein [Bacteroides sp.]